MIYQKLLAGVTPYFLDISHGGCFELHCHPEIELSYCFKGSYNIIINQKEYTLKEGDLALVSPMQPHELTSHISGDCLRLTAEVGPALLGEQFNHFISVTPKSNFFSFKKPCENPVYKELKILLDQTAQLLSSRPPFYNLSVKGNIYKISALLLELLSQNTKKTNHTFKSLIDIEKMGCAINIIYNRYNEQITLDTVSALCGYSKSNFCKTFKAITGESFHSMLNRHRIDVACLRLESLNECVEDIASSVGFADTKSFCRVFKKLKGISAGEYKKGIRKMVEKNPPTHIL